MSKDYFLKELEKLIDCKIVGVVHSDEEDSYEKYYGLKIADKRREETKIIWFLRDEEGNGPGSFTIEDFDEAEDFEEI